MGVLKWSYRFDSDQGLTRGFIRMTDRPHLKGPSPNGEVKSWSPMWCVRIEKHLYIYKKRWSSLSLPKSELDSQFKEWHGLKNSSSILCQQTQGIPFQEFCILGDVPEVGMSESFCFWSTAMPRYCFPVGHELNPFNIISKTKLTRGSVWLNEECNILTTIITFVARDL